MAKSDHHFEHILLAVVGIVAIVALVIMTAGIKTGVSYSSDNMVGVPYYMPPQEIQDPCFGENELGERSYVNSQECATKYGLGYQQNAYDE